MIRQMLRQGLREPSNMDLTFSQPFRGAQLVACRGAAISWSTCYAFKENIRLKGRHLHRSSLLLHVCLLA